MGKIDNLLMLMVWKEDKIHTHLSNDVSNL